MIKKVDRWLLPDGIEEILPEQARQTEHLRRKLVDLFQNWGYDYVIPPMVEFTDSLLTGTGQDTDLLTFKLVDQASGRTLGIRADITPQAARMDAHSLKREGVNRLCYAGHVLYTAPKSPLSSRSPIKVGVELFGVSGVDAEVEVVSLLLEALSAVSLQKQYIDLGHVGVFRSLASEAKLSDEQIATLFGLMQSKAFSDIDSWLASHIGDNQIKHWFSELAQLSGNARILERARQVYASAPAAVMACLDELQTLASIVTSRYPEAQLYFDLSELRGLHYHTGIVFGAFAPGVGNAIASGGRYDRVGKAFGRSRAATGFDVDLSAICRLLPRPELGVRGIFVQGDANLELWHEIQALRKSGERVVVGLLGQAEPYAYQSCDREMVKQGEGYIIRPLKKTG